jgi:hypothetical protein
MALTMRANPNRGYLPYYQVGTYPTKAGLPGRPIYRRNPSYVSPASMIQTARGKMRAEQEAFQKQLTEQAAATQADIAEQLKIVQEEKSAVAKMQEEYTASLKAEADAKRKAQEEQQLALQTAQANQMRAGRQANLQIQPAGQISRSAGTQRFKMRGQLPETRRALASGLNIGQSNSLNLG